MRKILQLLTLLFFTFSIAQNAPITFEPGEFGNTWTWTVFENEDNPPLEIVSNPDPSGINTSGTVAKFTARDAGQPFAGVESMHGSDIGTFDLSSSNSVVKIMVYKTKISNIGIKFATPSGGAQPQILVANTLINQWEEITINFSSYIGLPETTGLDQIIIFPDFIDRDADDIIYFDNITFSTPSTDPVTVDFDPEAAWLGFMNVFETPANGGGYVFGSGWGVPELQTVVDLAAGNVALQPNFNTYADNPTDPFWVDQSTGEGNKTMEANTYVEDNTLVGSEVTFTGPVAAYTLDAGYTAVAFIKVFNADFSVLKIETAPLVAGENFEVVYTNVEPSDTVLQYGFQVIGINANPANEVALGNVLIGNSNVDQVTVDFDPEAAWLGFMNVFETPANGGGYVFGSGWGVPELQTVVDLAAGNVALHPNFNTYADNPTDPFWVDQSTGEGNKTMEANTYVEDNTLVGSEVTFTGPVAAYTLDAGYTAVAFIKVFNADFSVLKIETAPLVAGENFEVVYTNVEPSDTVLQYGFQVIGINANPANEVALGNVLIGNSNVDQVTVDFDPEAAWLGFMNVFETPANGGGYVFGSGWGVPELQTVVDLAAGNVALHPNFNTYADNPTDPFWVDQSTGEGNKTMEANTYVEDNTLVGSEVTFTGPVAAYTLDAGYTAVAFIKVFNADFSVLKIETAPLVAGENFEVVYTNVEPSDTVLQYGFQVIGINANPANEVALGNVLIGNSNVDQVTVDFDPEAAWLGFMNVFETPANGGGYVFGSGWGVPELQTVVDLAAGNVALHPNFNTYADNPTDPFWVDQSTGEGNKTMEANTYVEDNTLVGSEVTFTGPVAAYTLDAGYTAVAFIKVFNADFSVLKIETAPLVAGENFEVVYTNVEPSDTVLQYGFQVIGINANPANEVALGNVLIGNPGASVPVNDTCENAIDLTCGETIAGTTIAATDDTDVAPDCDVTVSAPGVWYIYQDNSGFLADITLSTCDQADFDTKIHVYTGDCGVPPLTCVASNDDGAGCSGFSSELTFQSDGNTTYYILVNGFNGAIGNFDLTLTCELVPPENDLIENAIDLSTSSFPYTDPNVAMPAATTEGGNPENCNIDGANGVWYKATISEDGISTATIDTPGGFSSVTFYEAPNLNAVETDLVLLDWPDNQCVNGTTTTVPLVAGQSYYAFVVNTEANTDITFEWEEVLSVSDTELTQIDSYPNPVTNMWHVNAKESIVELTIYNLLGQKIMKATPNMDNFSVDMVQFDSGIYLAIIKTNYGIKTIKLIKE